jgi:multiple sugar transport system substrate-binding protein
MTKTVLRGITWQHRRAVDPLEASLPAFRRERPEVEVVWDARPLSGFEFQPVEELAAAYDLIVLDHPFCGEIVRTGCLAPLDDLAATFPEGAFVGPSLESYRYDERIWALPLDAACQTAVHRPDLLARLGQDVPRSWAEVLALGEGAAERGLRLAIALAGVHSLMTFFSLCANLGRPCGASEGDGFVDRDTAREALDALRRLIELCPPDVLDWNSIALQDAMAGRDDLVFCPAVYGFATYAEADNLHRLAYSDFTGLRAPFFTGSTLGGAGLGISASSKHPEAAKSYAAFLTGAEAQLNFTAHHGQPARREAWEDAGANTRFHGFYRGTRQTIESAWIRPRHAGYLAFQHAAGELVESHLRGAVTEAELLSGLSRLYVETGGPS